MYGSFIVKNINVSTSGGVLVNYDSLVDMSSLEDITPIIDILQALQHLDSPYYSFEIVHNVLTFKEIRFYKKIKGSF